MFTSLVRSFWVMGVPRWASVTPADEHALPTQLYDAEAENLGCLLPSVAAGVGQVRKDFAALTRMSRLSSGLSPGPTSLNRAALGRCLAVLTIEVRLPKTRGGDISVAAFLRAVHCRHWKPRLPVRFESSPAAVPFVVEPCLVKVRPTPKRALHCAAGAGPLGICAVSSASRRWRRAGRAQGHLEPRNLRGVRRGCARSHA